jgi:hypothetical protein
LSCHKSPLRRRWQPPLSRVSSWEPLPNAFTFDRCSFPEV